MSGWSTHDIPDQTGRTFIVTGANSGLGAETTKALVGAGAEVIMACRNTAKADDVARGLGDRARVAALDLADLASVRAFADGVGSIDVLINNAGVMALPLRRTADGFEMQMGTNHLGHFALTGLLLPKIGDRVVTLSSGLHQLGRIDLADLDWRNRRYRRWRAYGDSKMANLMFGMDLADRFDAADGDGRLSLIAHPGYAATELQGHTESLMDSAMKIGNLFAQSAADGALPTLYAATAPDVVNGTFYGPSHFFGMRGAPGVSAFSGRANDRAIRDGLWAESEKLTGVSYPI
ncbi:putative oxidoreductase, short-chain dehydrogenase/reductase family [Gordonia polyisoprenivorans VH2]|uniref:Putative oxidoreductase, short-chain dehydrogenase/reductase family n=1 Tax=Gordonia polyisoprenivorans (strain DSM 44266 / VH2) TaxID=1112204 RepID=H6MRZ6_GORPV|nr:MULTISPECIES: oxidoreductase [Gordonia]AFA75009.1 putative oxidoreductase, short-chain dehydrogenase/reductase family [Gordonia polyisoprenivorans VH2]MBE7193443.1 SDR family NAD(P)-dependent oxidoreductase [Gordonia polyisoprenivorans]MDF3282729.1 oxidoreductase [Gordonia sp. N1V]OPX16460.1 short-chain dehydrogenase [Gordonia sp. i37]QUD83684.1 SDR family NAD(P)-dependent oxidoreductase [Gordonia polyisoprenivorans]